MRAEAKKPTSGPVKLISAAVDKLLDVGGASGFAESSPVQRIWRDLGTASRHPAFVTEIDRERYARLLLGFNGQ